MASLVSWLKRLCVSSVIILICFWNRPSLYNRDRLHQNKNGSQEPLVANLDVGMQKSCGRYPEKIQK